VAPERNPNQLRLPGLDVPIPGSGVTPPVDTTTMAGANKIMDEYLLKQDKVLAGWGDLNTLVEQHANTLQSIYRVNEGIATSSKTISRHAKDRLVYGVQEAKLLEQGKKEYDARIKAEERIGKLRDGNIRAWRKELAAADMLEKKNGVQEILLRNTAGEVTQRVPVSRAEAIFQKMRSGQALRPDETGIASDIEFNLKRDMTGRNLGVGLDTNVGGFKGMATNATAVLSGAMRGHIDTDALSGLMGGRALGLPIGRALPAIGIAYEGWKRVIAPALAMRREATSMGQVSGQGTTAGISAKWEAMTMGANPFDMITGATAMAIVKGVREAGFSGEVAQQVDQGVKGTIEDLGISVDSSIKMVSTAMRQGGESIKQITGEMKNFDAAAKEAGDSVQQYTDNVQANADILRATGAGSAATAQAAGLENAFTQKMGFPNGGKDVAAFIGNQANAGILAAMSGTGANPMTAGPQVFIQGWQQMTGRLIDQAMTRTNGNTAEAARFLSRSGSPFFGGMPANQVEAYIRLHQNRPTAVTDNIRLATASRGYTSNYERLARQAAERQVGSGLAHFQLERLGIMDRHLSREEQIERVANWIQSHPSGRDSGGFFGNDDQSGSRLSPGIPLADLLRVRRRALSTAMPYLTEAGRKDLREHLSDYHDNFEKRLQDDILHHRRTRKSQKGDTVGVYPGDSVIITLDPKSKKLSLSTDPSQNYNRAVAHGETPSNARPASLRPVPGLDLLDLRP
jgi:hypothetical protein